MRWPWKRTRSNEQLIISWSGQTLAYVVARAKGWGQFDVLRMGVERQGGDDLGDFAQRLKNLKLGRTATVMLRPRQYQILQIASPSVPPEEMRSAARYQIRDMVEMHLDDLTLDVLNVGNGQDKSAGQMFVVAAPNTAIRDVMSLAQAVQWDVSVIDIQELAQRNLQTALSQASGGVEQATAAVVITNARQAVLTICAHGELYYSRRVDLPEGLATIEWGKGATAVPDLDGYTPVGEYVPSHDGGAGYGSSYEPAAAAAPALAQTDAERSQRLVVEMLRSVDTWDRAWSSLPLAGMRVAAGERSGEMADWLTREIGHSVSAMDLGPVFSGLDAIAPADRLYCLPLLGVLLRT